MTPDTETRTNLYGTSGMAGGILLLVYTVPDLIAPETFSGSGRIATIYGAFNLVILGLLAVGLVGLHGQVRERTGRVERIGYYVSLVGFAVGILSLGHLYGIGSENDASFITFVLGIFTFVLGSALVGFDSWRAGALPRRRAFRPRAARHTARFRPRRDCHRNAVRRHRHTVRRCLDRRRPPPPNGE